MKKKVKLADVLWEAANRYLALGVSSEEPPYEFSCPAITCALNNGATVYLSVKADNEYVHNWLRSLGCESDSWSCFKGFAAGEERQGVRYMWLLLAMHVAEDEGIELEVESA
jgi:hypothetical protein